MNHIDAMGGRWWRGLKQQEHLASMMGHTHRQAACKKHQVPLAFAAKVLASRSQGGGISHTIAGCVVGGGVPHTDTEVSGNLGAIEIQSNSHLSPV